MGEIKFRAWSGSKKAMYRVLGYSDIEQCFFVQGKGRGKAPLADIVLMQYTGLKDKNGKEIYEGDVVSNGEFVRYLTGQERRSSYYVGIVRYDTKSGCLVINNNNGRTKRLTVKVIKNNRVQVIGNIYEKPELMAQTND